MLKDGFKAKRLRVRATLFTIVDGQLYKRGFTMSHLKCLRSVEAREVLFEVYARICGNH